MRRRSATDAARASRRWMRSVSTGPNRTTERRVSIIVIEPSSLGRCAERAGGARPSRSYAGSRPRAPRAHIERDDGAGRTVAAVLLVFGGEELEGGGELGTRRDDPRLGVHPHPPELGPVVRVVVDDEGGDRVRLDVANPLEPCRRLRLRVDRGVEGVAARRE